MLIFKDLSEGEANNSICHGSERKQSLMNQSRSSDTFVCRIDYSSVFPLVWLLKQFSPLESNSSKSSFSPINVRLPSLLPARSTCWNSSLAADGSIKGGRLPWHCTSLHTGPQFTLCQYNIYIGLVNRPINILYMYVNVLCILII